MRKMKESGVEWIGKIPFDWKLERLQWHLSEIKEVNKPEKSKQILSLTNKLGVIPYEEKGAQGNVSKEDYSQYKLAYPGTIVANSMNILIGSVGKCDYFGCVSPVYYVYKPNECENLDFINFIFQTEQFQKELRRYANGILEIRLRVSSNDILKRKLAFPSKNIQEKIVAELNKKNDEIATLIGNVERQIEKLKAYKQSLITEVVTKGLDKKAKMKDSGVDWIGQIPELWRVIRVKNHATTSSGGTPTSGDTSNYDGGINWVCSYDLHETTIFKTGKTLSEKGANSIAGEMQLPNSILIAMYGGAGTIGNSGLLKCNARTNQAICSVHFDEDIVYPEYAFYQTIAIRKYWMIFAVGTRKDPNINQDVIRNMWYIIPSLDEQQQIASYLDSKCSQIDRLIEIKQQKIEKLNQYKKSLIYEYVTGKREVA